jgi:diadenosine tetraphosphate (Ap4A) HIT family hydrolase
MYALPMMSENSCELCSAPGGEVLWSDECCRVVRVTGHEGTAFPGFCRVIWQPHVVEMSDLTEAEAGHLMRIVAAVERTLRELLAPDKINLASLGNLVPHLHWHVIPRWHDDSHFPYGLPPVERAPCAPYPPAPHLAPHYTNRFCPGVTKNDF